jgi:hypothetical protein
MPECSSSRCAAWSLRWFLSVPGAALWPQARLAADWLDAVRTGNPGNLCRTRRVDGRTYLHHDSDLDAVSRMAGNCAAGVCALGAALLLGDQFQQEMAHLAVERRLLSLVGILRVRPVHADETVVRSRGPQPARSSVTSESSMCAIDRESNAISNLRSLKEVKQSNKPCKSADTGICSAKFQHTRRLS